MNIDTEYTRGERRYSSAGNIFELVDIISRDGIDRFRIKRIGIIGQDRPELWDADIVYSWTEWQWESLPLVGQESDTPHFGKFVSC